MAAPIMMNHDDCHGDDFNDADDYGYGLSFICDIVLNKSPGSQRSLHSPLETHQGAKTELTDLILIKMLR